MKFLPRLAISCTLVALIIWYLGGLEEIIAIISQTDLRYLLAGALVLTLDRILMTYKWSGCGSFRTTLKHIMRPSVGGSLQDVRCDSA